MRRFLRSPLANAQVRRGTARGVLGSLAVIAGCSGRIDNGGLVPVSGGGVGGNDAATNAGSSAGGSSGSLLLDVDVSGVARSTGCGRPAPVAQEFAKYTAYTMHVTGRTLDPSFSVAAHDRGYYVWLPKDYDAAKAYRVTFLFMGCGDRNAAATATYKLMIKDPESIYVAMNMPPAGFPPDGRDCYDSYTGKQSIEWEFMGLVGSEIQQLFCVDENRLFVAGYSSGAWVSNMFGCYFAGRDPGRKFGSDIAIRGQTTDTGGPVQPDVPCGGKVAALWMHDVDDRENVISGNILVSLPRVLAVNGCTGGAQGPTAPWGSTPNLSDICQQYTACPPDYPVIFCTTIGKAQSSQDDLTLPGFIEFQNLMNAN